MQLPTGIPVPLYPGETLQQYTRKFEYWLGQRAQSLAKLRNDPSRERNFWFSFAYQRAESISEKKRSIPSNPYNNLCYEEEIKRVRLEERLQVVTSGTAQFGSEIRAHSTAGEGHFPVESNGEQVTATSLPDSLPDWAVELIDRVEGLERQAMFLQREVRDLQTAASSQSDSHGDTSCTKPSDMKSDAGMYPEHIESVNNEADEKKGTNDVNHVVYPEDITPSTHISTKDYSEMRRLAKEYCCLANQVTVNEVAMDDALNYFKEANGVDGYQAIDRRNRIMTLVISINQEKRKRSGALVDLLIHEWCGEEEKLLSILQEDLATTLSSKAQHDKLVEISLRLEEKYAELDRLEAQFSEQVQLSKLKEIC
ncbi:uncharacterized protein PITG_04894 [Phytophthora infestans T30-4]|uniref:Uncharacterized protein n=1 Tax=Phytophthora infestans (strain T30-4) TaxID=403677 RepID=D0N2A9_PHYIT|nr:uncharacterized protein PITG_04894 [Phytophthora infestans T30-4]EEY68438.1 hypothetical protein PITG_04894 [Phytophthora infestans T30-4]|eukprot:XP_002905597.1 hypothetical protein PITG_04894 [Phytophthora infestans T30-4]